MQEISKFLNLLKKAQDFVTESLVENEIRSKLLVGARDVQEIQGPINIFRVEALDLTEFREDGFGVDGSKTTMFHHRIQGVWRKVIEVNQAIENIVFGTFK